MKQLNIYYFKAHWFLFIFSVTKNNALCRAVNLKSRKIGKNTQVSILKFNEIDYLYKSAKVKSLSLIGRNVVIDLLKKNNISTEFMPVVETKLFPQARIF